jgi:hypothetical protein
VVVVADFPEVLCTDAAFEKNCPLQGETYFGQDGNYTINPESWTYISSGDERMVEAVTGFTWATAAYPADSYADATAACTALSTATYGGATDWRVPSLRELGRIISRTGGGGTWPPNMERIQNSVWWTSTPDKGDASRMVGMSGNWPTTLRVPTAGGAGDFEGARYTYCVNGPEMAGAWLENADGVTVSHTTTGLMWHRSASTNQAMDWNTALQYCESSEAGGFTDWRLPTLREYSSVFDLDTATGFMSDAFGPEPFVNMFTGTPNIVGGGSDAEIAWAREDIGVLDQTNVNVLTGAVRCVRGPG